MQDRASLECTTCRRRFAAELPMSRARLAASSLMFLVESCSHCRASDTYLRSDYRFDLAVAAPSRLSA